MGKIPKKVVPLYAVTLGKMYMLLSKSATEDERFCAVYILSGGRTPEIQETVVEGLFSPDKAFRIVSAVITRASEDLGWPNDVVNILLEHSSNIIWESPIWLEQPQDVQDNLKEIGLSNGFSRDRLPYIVLANPVTRGSLHVLQHKKHIHWAYIPSQANVGTLPDGRMIYFGRTEWSKAKVRA